MEGHPEVHFGLREAVGAQGPLEKAAVAGIQDDAAAPQGGQVTAAEVLAQKMLGVNWLLVLGGFVLVSWLASRAAHTARSRGTQYAALIGFVFAEAIIFVPLLYVAQYHAGGGVIESAAILTLVGFAALTAIAFWTRKDFSFLGAVLRWAMIVALLAIVPYLVGTFLA